MTKVMLSIMCIMCVTLQLIVHHLGLVWMVETLPPITHHSITHFLSLKNPQVTPQLCLALQLGQSFHSQNSKYLALCGTHRLSIVSAHSQDTCMTFQPRPILPLISFNPQISQNLYRTHIISSVVTQWRRSPYLLSSFLSLNLNPTSSSKTPSYILILETDHIKQPFRALLLDQIVGG